MGPVQFFRFDDNIWTGPSLSLFQKWQKDRTGLDYKALEIIEGKKTVPMMGCFILLTITSILTQIT
jgi:hypothetical protein